MKIKSRTRQNKTVVFYSFHLDVTFVAFQLTVELIFYLHIAEELYLFKQTCFKNVNFYIQEFFLSG